MKKLNPSFPSILFKNNQKTFITLINKNNKKTNNINNNNNKDKKSSSISNIVNPSKFNFSLYIPQKKLVFHNHEKYGLVYPVYMADTSHNKKNNPKKIKPLLYFFSFYNLFFLMTGFQILPITYLYELLFINDTTLFFTSLTNIFLVQKYLKFVFQYESRVKNMYLLPDGTKIIIEAFNGKKNEILIQDIFERRVYLRYEGKDKDSIFTNNENSFRANIGWGFNKENFFEGKRKILDYEIFYQIINRVNIDTTQVKFSKTEIPLNFLSPEEKRKLVRRFSDRKILRKFDFKYNKLLGNYFYLKYYVYFKDFSFMRKKMSKKEDKKTIISFRD